VLDLAFGPGTWDYFVLECVCLLYSCFFLLSPPSEISSVNNPKTFMRFALGFPSNKFHSPPSARRVSRSRVESENSLFTLLWTCFNYTM